jgi:hypothetical protein
MDYGYHANDDMRCKERRSRKNMIESTGSKASMIDAA